MRITIFDQVKTPPQSYYSPALYCNVEEPLVIGPRKKVLVAFIDSSKYYRQTEQYNIVLSKGKFFQKMSYYKFCIVLFNTSYKSKIVCNPNCSLQKLLEHKHINHRMVHVKPSLIMKQFCRYNKCRK